MVETMICLELRKSIENTLRGFRDALCIEVSIYYPHLNYHMITLYMRYDVIKHISLTIKPYLTLTTQSYTLYCIVKR